MLHTIVGFFLKKAHIFLLLDNLGCYIYLIFMSKTHFEQVWGVDLLSSISESSEPAIMMHTRCRQFLLLMVDFLTQNKEEEQVKKDEPIKPKSKLETKMGLAEKGDITIRGDITGILKSKRGT
jgi:hypothetical protein